MLARLSGADLQKAQAEQEIAWRTRLSDFLERYPHAEHELRALVAEVQTQVIGSAGWVEQHIAGFDQAQQATLGTGVQNVDFGGQCEHGARR